MSILKDKQLIQEKITLELNKIGMAKLNLGNVMLDFMPFLMRLILIQV